MVDTRFVHLLFFLLEDYLKKKEQFLYKKIFSHVAQRELIFCDSLSTITKTH